MILMLWKIWNQDTVNLENQGFVLLCTFVCLFENAIERLPCLGPVVIFLLLLPMPVIFLNT